MMKLWLMMLYIFLATTLMPIAQAAGLNGYDPVSYFADDKPVKGSSTMTAEFRGEKYRFSSARNLDAFIANPEKYLPQYGGYCAWAVAQGQLAPGDPAVAKAVNNKLYFNVNRDIAARWEKDIPGFIQSADANWPKIKK